jgi:hypothetical protein
VILRPGQAEQHRQDGVNHDGGPQQHADEFRAEPHKRKIERHQNIVEEHCGESPAARCLLPPEPATDAEREEGNAGDAADDDRDARYIDPSRSFTSKCGTTMSNRPVTASTAAAMLSTDLGVARIVLSPAAEA